MSQRSPECPPPSHPLAAALVGGDLDAVRAGLIDVEIPAFDEREWTTDLFALAVFGGDLRVLQYLIGLWGPTRPDLLCRVTNWGSVLHIGVRRRSLGLGTPAPEMDRCDVHELSLARFLLGACPGLDPNTKDAWESPALDYATSPDMVRILVQAGTRLEDRNVRHSTALLEHLREESAPDIIAELLHQGADVRASYATPFFRRATPLLVAAGASRPDWSFTVVRLLLDAGAEVSPPGALWTPLHRAVYLGNTAAAVELAARGADLHSRAHPLHKRPLDLVPEGRTDLAEVLRALCPSRDQALVAIHGIVSSSSSSLDPDLADLVVHYLALPSAAHAGLAHEYCVQYGR